MARRVCLRRLLLLAVGLRDRLSITEAPSATTSTAAQKAGLRMTGGAPLPRGPDGASTSNGLALRLARPARTSPGSRPWARRRS